MKNLLSYLPKKAFVFLVSILAVVGISAGVLASFGPDRPTYTWQHPADHITFNSITDNPVIGDERAFLTASAPGEAYTDPVNSLQNGDEFTLRVYYHNNAAKNLNLKATNTTVKVALPSGSKTSQQVTAYISADNATPKTVYDTVDLTAANKGYFELEYVAGSAILKNNSFTNGVKLSDSIVTTGALVGFDKIDGIVPGCECYSGWVTLKLKVKMPSYSVEKQARLTGEGADAWRETVTAKAGDTIQWLVTVRNTGTTTLEHIVVLDQVPGNMTVVPGSVKLINSNYPSTNPYVYPDSAIQANGSQINVDTGDYLANSTSYVRFNTTVTDEKQLVCGDNKFTNEAFATPKGYGAVHDKAYVVINKDCGQPVYRCDNLTVATAEGRSINAQVATTANNGATLSLISYDFGDGSQKLVTDKTSVTYTYAKDGTYTVKAVPSFKVGDKTVAATSDSCIKQVSFSTTPTPTPTPTPSKEIPNTGTGSLLGLFMGTSITGAVGYRVWMLKRLGR
jgi:uncharacterized repeat protein (TIGR01451 family)